MNQTTVQSVAATIGNRGARIDTFEANIPRVVLAELNTHRAITKSAASSRAIPVAKRVDMVRTNPYVPENVGKNKAGMSADVNLSDEEYEKFVEMWTRFGLAAATIAEAMVEQTGAHKQEINRLLEPWSYVKVVVTATEWENFFNLRMSPAAYPAFQDFAGKLFRAYGDAKPKHSMYHLPYTDDMPPGSPIDDLYMVSAARCARVSYKTFDGIRSTFDDDKKLCAKLLEEGHLSPFDHPAMGDSCYYKGESYDSRRWWMRPVDHRQYWGWIPHRVAVERNLGMVCARNSFAPIPLPGTD